MRKAAGFIAILLVLFVCEGCRLDNGLEKSGEEGYGKEVKTLEAVSWISWDRSIVERKTVLDLRYVERDAL